jgi:hypothetical protein
MTETSLLLLVSGIASVAFVGLAAAAVLQPQRARKRR